MNTSDDLFKLIKAMSPTEKRYFKLYAASHMSTDNNCMHLFDILDKMKEYNYDKVKDKIKSQKYAKHLPATKYYLYKILLKSLRNYYSGKNDYFKLTENLDFVQILMNKNLLGSASIIIDNSKKIAGEIEQFNLLSEFQDSERKLVTMNFFSATDTKDKLLKLEKELSDTYAKTLNVQHYRANLNKMIGLDHNNPNNKEVINVLTENLKNKKYTVIDNAQSNNAQLYYFLHSIFCAIYNVGEISGKVEAKKLISFWEQVSPSYLNYNVSAYLYTINNIIGYLTRTGELKLVKQCLSNSEAMKKKVKLNLLQTSQWTSFYYKWIAEIYNETGEFEIGLEKIKNASEEINLWKSTASTLEIRTLDFYVGLLNMGNLNYKDASKIFYKITTDKNEDIFHLQSHAIILHLICQYEIGNVELIKKLAQRAEKKISKVSPHLISLITIAQFFSNTKLKHTKNDFKSLQHQLIVQSKNTNEPLSTLYNYEKWIKSKL